MKTVTAKYNWLKDSNLRLDASFHLSDGRIAKTLIEKCPYDISSLRKCTDDIFYGGRAKRLYVKKEDNGIPFMGSSDMLKSDFSSLKLISKKLTKNLSSLYLKKGWTLVSRSGTIGNTAYVNRIFEEKTASEHIIRVVPNNKIKSGYLYAFLSSKYGYSLLTQGTFGAVIQHIEPDFIASLPIPLFPKEKQQQIHKLIVEASMFKEIANKNLTKATSYFESKFNITNEFKTIFLKNIKNFDFSWTGRNNDVIIEGHVQNIKSQNYYLIGDESSKVFAPPLFKHIYLETDNGHPFYTGRQLSNFIRVPERYLSTRGVRNIEDYKVQKGTILIYKSGPRDGMIGSVFLVDDSIVNGCLSDHVIRVNLRNKELISWTFAYLKSKIGKRILHNLASGTAILFITPERVSNIVIPAPDENVEQINKYVNNYVGGIEEANNKESEAIEIIENEISSWQ